VNMRAHVATTEGEMNRIMTACINYYHDHNSFPGPIPDIALQGTNTTPGMVNGQSINLFGPDNSALPDASKPGLTSSENLVLGLIGLLNAPGASGGNIIYNPPPHTHDVPNLNYLRPASFHYMDYVSDELTPQGLMYAN